jgi:hypothetical protein
MTKSRSHRQRFGTDEKASVLLSLPKQGRRFSWLLSYTLGQLFGFTAKALPIMRTHQAATMLLTAASCLIGHLGWAQQAPIAPLAPAAPVVAPPVSDLGVKVEEKQSGALAPTTAAPHQSQPVIVDPIYLINGHYLGSSGMLSIISPQQIDKLEIYKPGRGPVQWRSLTASGIVSLTLKAKPKLKLKARSLVAIKRGLGLHGSVRFEFNGAPIQDESLQIVTSAIAGLDVTQPALGTADKTVVNIRSTAFKPAGPQAVPAQPEIHPPGTIIIRGLARQ